MAPFDVSAKSDSHAEQSDGSKPKLECTHDWVQDGSVDMQGRPVRRSKTGGWKACGFIIVDEMSERLAYYGIASNLIVYLTTVLHEGLAPSARNVNNWMGVSYILPVVGAFVADVFWGRYWTITALSIVYLLGLVSLTLSVSIRGLKPPPCANPVIACPQANSAQLGVFFFSLYLISVGTGGVKPCLEAFGADQFDEEDPKERRRKSSFFNLWNFGLCLGAMIAFSALVYVQDNFGWGVGFGIPAGAMAVAVCIFLAGTPFYRHKQPGGSPLTRVSQVFVAAVRNWRVEVPSDSNLLYETVDEESQRIGRRQLRHTPSISFLDKAAVKPSQFDRIIDGGAIKASPWRLCTVTQVEEVKLLVRIVPIWLATFMYGAVTAQITTFFTKQGSTLDRHLGSRFIIPAASVQSFTTITIVVLLPIYDRVFVPFARKFTGHERGITLLQRIGLGLFLSIVSLIVAALAEGKRLHVAAAHDLLDNPKVSIPLSIAWLLPQYVLMGISDVFAIVGQQEFFYDQMPDALRSLGMGLYLCAAGVGGFLSSILITMVQNASSHGGKHAGWFTNNLNRSHLDYFYWLLAILSTVNFVIFMIVAHFYTYKKPQTVNAALSSSATIASAYSYTNEKLKAHTTNLHPC